MLAQRQKREAKLPLPYFPEIMTATYQSDHAFLTKSFADKRKREV